jgi:hypothetical protein
MDMDPVTFAVVFIGGAGVLALWFDRRFPGRTPTGMLALGFHVLAAIVFVRLLPSSGSRILDALSAPAPELANLFAFVLPAVIYFFVVAVWMIRFAQGLLQGRFH